MKTDRKQFGFTAVEIMIVLAITCILALIAFPAYEKAVRSSQRQDARQALFSAAQSLERQYTAANEYPSDVQTLFSDQKYWEVGITVSDKGQAYIITANQLDKGLKDPDCDAVMKLKSTGEKLPASGCW